MVQLENLGMIPHNKIDTKTQRYIWRGVWGRRRGALVPPLYWGELYSDFHTN